VLRDNPLVTRERWEANESGEEQQEILVAQCSKSNDFNCALKKVEREGRESRQRAGLLSRYSVGR
jgi:hypothetical protein